MSNSHSLWSDEPATQDLLSFKAIASTVVDTLFDDGLNPVALCLSGSWGSGKTSVLELIKADYYRKRKRVRKGPCNNITAVVIRPIVGRKGKANFRSFG